MKQATPNHAQDAPRISGVIVARNEENKIALALESVRSIVQEIVFFDMDSSDGTGAIAETYGATVVRVPPMAGQEPARPLAVAKATGDWILMFDADEILSPSFGKGSFVWCATTKPMWSVFRGKTISSEKS